MIDMLSGLPVLDVDFNDVREDDTVVICRATSFNCGMARAGPV